MISQMRERITILKNEVSVDEVGNHVLAWKEFFSCNAYVNNLSGKEYYAAASVNAQNEIYFVIRYCSELKNIDTEHYRIMFRDEQYNITFIDNVMYCNKTMKLRVVKTER